ncbi:MAG TPA: hypothetical protein PK720_01305 [bacterium]|nr:hypothetical protein [bacterium]
MENTDNIVNEQQKKDNDLKQSKFFDNIVNLIGSYIILIPASMVLGALLDGAAVAAGLNIFWFWIILPLFVLALTCVYVMTSAHPVFGTIIILVVIFTIIFIGFHKFKQRYPLIDYATHTKELQEEVDIAKNTEAPFVESFRMLYGDDTLMFSKTCEEMKVILNDKGKKEAREFFRKKVLEFKEDREYNDSTEIILKSVSKNKDSRIKEDERVITVNNSKIEYQKSFSSSGTKETLYFDKVGDTKKTSIIYLAPGQRIRVYASTKCKIYTSKIDVTPGVWEAYNQDTEGLVTVEGVGQRGNIVIEVL